MRTLVLAVLCLAAPAFAADKPAAPPTPAAPAAGRKVEIQVTEAGFQPKDVKAKKGEPLTLVFTRVTDATCIKAIDIPDEKVKAFELPLNKPVSLIITPTKVGVTAFHCTALAMGDGKIIVE